jgi:hypothetical protein
MDGLRLPFGAIAEAAGAAENPPADTVSAPDGSSIMTTSFTCCRALSLAVAACFAVAGGASAQQYVYPAKGQSPDKQKSDEAACHTWAVDQSQYDPAKPPPARGAVVGEVVADDASTGAAVGAVAARGQSRRQSNQQNQQAAAQQQQAVSSGQAAYGKARQACLEGRGYTVK